MPDDPLTPGRAAQRPVYAVAGGNHVTVLLDRAQTGGDLDVIEVTARPGGGPPPHRHAFAEWFQVLEGELTICEERDGTVVPTSVLTVGDTLWIPPWTVHGTLNLGETLARFAVISRPGAMSGYLAEAGVRVADALTPPDHDPAGPAQLAEISARWGIEFWTGPVDRSPDAAHH
jgi:quercetin dioxygenase-like cupin family protein